MLVSMTGALSGQVAVVTGAGRGIGRACAVRLACAGADIGVLDVDLLIEDGKLIGAIGCSGGAGSQDEVACVAGAATINK